MDVQNWCCNLNNETQSHTFNHYEITNRTSLFTWLDYTYVSPPLLGYTVLYFQSLALFSLKFNRLAIPCRNWYQYPSTAPVLWSWIHPDPFKFARSEKLALSKNFQQKLKENPKQCCMKICLRFNWYFQRKFSRIRASKIFEGDPNDFNQWCGSGSARIRIMGDLTEPDSHRGYGSGPKNSELVKKVLIWIIKFKKVI